MPCASHATTRVHIRKPPGNRKKFPSVPVVLSQSAGAMEGRDAEWRHFRCGRGLFQASTITRQVRPHSHPHQTRSRREADRDSNQPCMLRQQASASSGTQSFFLFTFPCKHLKAGVKLLQSSSNSTEIWIKKGPLPQKPKGAGPGNRGGDGGEGRTSATASHFG